MHHFSSSPFVMSSSSDSSSSSESSSSSSGEAGSSSSDPSSSSGAPESPGICRSGRLSPVLEVDEVGAGAASHSPLPPVSFPRSDGEGVVIGGAAFAVDQYDVGDSGVKGVVPAVGRSDVGHPIALDMGCPARRVGVFGSSWVSRRGWLTFLALAARPRTRAERRG